MTDTRARDALAAALRSAWADWTDECEGEPEDYQADHLLDPTTFTTDQRRALAAAFLDVETLAEALCSVGMGCPVAGHNEPLDIHMGQAVAVLSALEGP